MARVVLIASFVLWAAPLLGQTNYYPTILNSPVGTTTMDLNGDGVRGEAGVDDLHCDEDGETLNVTSNLNFEDFVTGVTTAQIYVDQDTTGNDDSGCGLPGDACSSIEHALNTRKGDAEAQGADHVFVCIKGTRTSGSIDMASTSWDGGTGTTTLVAATRSSSNQLFDFEFADRPTALVSWDQDSDGSYPPFDTDDTPFEIDHGGNHFNCSSAANCVSRFTVSGLTSRHAGRGSSTSGFFYDTASGKPAGRGEHIAFHGNHIYDVNEQSCQYSGKIVISDFSNDDYMFYFGLNDVTFGGGYFNRGGGEQEGKLIEKNRVLISVIGGSELNTDFNGLTCCSDATDPGCTNSSNVGGSDTTGANIGRLWCPRDSGVENWDIVDNLFGIDTSKGGGDGYINGTGPTSNSQISAGILLSGCDGFNASGNMAHNIAGIPFGIVAYDDGISIDKSPRDYYLTNNTIYHDRADAVPSGSVFGIAGINQQGTGGSNLTRQTVFGDWHFNSNCADLGVNTEDIDEGLLLLGPGTLDLTAVDMEIKDNAILGNWNGTRGVIWIAPNQNCNADCLPATLDYSGNIFSDEVGDDGDYMVKAVQEDWSSTCSAGTCDNNTYYGDLFQDDGTNYDGLALWQAQWGEASSVVNDNAQHPGCFLPTEGTNYATGPAPSSPSLSLPFAIHP